MALVTYPLNNIEYTAEDAELFHVTRTSGVYANDSFGCSATGTDNNVVIGTGIGWIKNNEFAGKVIAQKEPLTVDVGLADSMYPRIDAIVIQFDANKNETNIVAKFGTASSVPVAPPVTRTESIYELHLYHIRREAGSLYVAPENIEDLRLNDSYCGLMTDSITKAVDTTLTMTGIAADSAAVGSALKRRAPAGYGLGENNALFASTDAATKSGWYSAPYPKFTGQATLLGNGLMRVDSESADYFAQTMYMPNESEIRRTYSNGTFSEWEWINPPMIANTEYRTAERYLGKAVYVKLLDCEVLPNSTHKDTAIGATMTNVVSYEVVATDADNNWRYTLPYIAPDGTVRCVANVVGYNIRIYAINYDMSGYTGKAIVKYTKD